MVAQELRDRMEKMSQFELQELAAYADQLRIEARTKEVTRGLDDILDKWQQLLACVRRVKSQLGVDDLWLEVRDWGTPYAEGSMESISVGQYADGEDYIFSAHCHDDGEHIEREAE